jgi:uncharacterized protein (TIGR02444 family)
VTNSSSAFWDFSLRVYALPGISEECLGLQDRFGTNVNLLLFCTFCGAKFGARLSDDDLREASALVGPWHTQVTKSMRAARNAIKRHQPEAASHVRDAMESLRQVVKQLELSAERIEHEILENWWLARSQAMTPSTPSDAIKSNIKLLLGPGAEAPTLMRAALADP